MAKHAPTVPRLTDPVFLVTAHDAADSELLREQHLDAHLEYVERHCDEYLICGPLKATNETRLCGSFFLVAAADEAGARALVSGDPYVANGVYQQLDVKQAVASAGRFIGGVIWQSGDDIRARQKEESA